MLRAELAPLVIIVVEVEEADSAISDKVDVDLSGVLGLKTK